MYRNFPSNSSSHQQQTELEKFSFSINSIKCATISNYKFDKCLTFYSLFRVSFCSHHYKMFNQSKSLLFLINYGG